MIRIIYVTITYNAEAVLQRTLDSLLQQDYPKITHLIIDGASTDGTLAMVDNYIKRSNAADNGHRIQVTSEPDSGIYDAMNKGLRSIDGDYVCFLNAGDYLPAGDTASKIATAAANFQISNLHSQLPAVLYGDTDIVDGDGHFLHHRRLSLRNISRGVRSVRACSSVTRLSMLVQISPSTITTTCATDTLPM